MTRRTMDFYHRMACSTVWNERRSHETFRAVATRCAEEMAQRGLEDVDPQKVLEWAVDERADRMARNHLQTVQNKKMLDKREAVPEPKEEMITEIRKGLLRHIEEIDREVVEGAARNVC